MGPGRNSTPAGQRNRPQFAASDFLCRETLFRSLPCLLTNVDRGPPRPLCAGRGLSFRDLEASPLAVKPASQPEAHRERFGEVDEVDFTCGRVEVDDAVRMYYGEADTVASARNRQGCGPVRRAGWDFGGMRRDDI